MDLNYDVVEEQLRDDSGDIILEYNTLDYDENVLPELDGEGKAVAYNVEYPLEYIGIYPYESYLKKDKDKITQEDLDNIDVDKFYMFLVDYYMEDAMRYAYDNRMYEWDIGYYED